MTFVLPAAVAQPTAAAGPRLVGWALAAAFCIPACMLVWPTPWHDHLRRRLSATSSAVARLAAAWVEERPDPEAEAEATIESELSLLREQFAATPYPPTGAAAGAVALAKLVGRVEWAAGNAARVRGESASLELEPVREVIGAAAETLRLSASLICDGSAHPVDDPALVEGLRQSRERMDELIAGVLDAEVSTLINPASDPDTTVSWTGASWTGASWTGASWTGASWTGTGSGTTDHRGDITSSLDPSFRARALGIATGMVADAALEAAGAEPEDRGGMRFGEGTRRVFRRKLAPYLSFRSVWFRNAVRGAAGLALAVAVVEATDVEHGFWVVLGTLSVLRSNALGTGSTALRAVAGTAAGVVVGSAVMIGVPTIRSCCGCSFPSR